MLRPSLVVVAALACSQPAFAETVLAQKRPATPVIEAPMPPAIGNAPKLIVAISVDQFSADLFAEYRGQFTGGLKRMQEGAVFPSGYQSHAATETCPGHSTILTGNHPTKTGIFANDWIDPKSSREDKTIYCAEDESVAGSTSKNYTVSDIHLKVPTLGDRVKAANPASRVVSVAGKDRAAVMMGGHNVDELWWWDGKQLTSYAGRNAPPAVTKMNTVIAEGIAKGLPETEAQAACSSRNRAVSIGGGKTVGDGKLALAAGDRRGFRATPYFDSAILKLSADLALDMKLGQSSNTDILTIGASATDYVGHSFGTSGSEMCINLLSLDKTLGLFFNALDTTGVDYAVVLTADHGGHDLPERIREQSSPDAARIGKDLDPAKVGETIAKTLKLKLKPKKPLLYGSSSGDVWIAPGLSKTTHAKVRTMALAAYRKHPMVSAVYSRSQILAASIPSAPPETWTIVQRIRASFDPVRGGDFYVALKPRITPIPDPTNGTVATHGSVWDYDRRVPILFWRKGMKQFEQPLSVMTVDIAPSLAALIGLNIPKGAMDGRCLDLDAGSGTTCR
jgi:predicted AlkP superfamily pyrophosphatase or phosphodiesterase